MSTPGDKKNAPFFYICDCSVGLANFVTNQLFWVNPLDNHSQMLVIRPFRPDLQGPLHRRKVSFLCILLNIIFSKVKIIFSLWLFLNFWCSGLLGVRKSAA